MGSLDAALSDRPPVVRGRRRSGRLILGRMSSSEQHLKGTAIVAIGVVVLSFDALFVRLSETTAWNVVFWRGWMTAGALLAYMVVRSPRKWFESYREGGWPLVVAAAMMGVGLLLFPLSVTHTVVANTVVILATAPFFAAVFTWMFLGEVVPGRTWAAIGVVVVGTAAVFWGGLSAGGTSGDLFALAAAVSFGANMTWLRLHRHLPRIPIVCLCGLISACIAAPMAAPAELTGSGVMVLSVSGFVQMPLAMVLVTIGTRYLPAAEVSLLLLIETVLGPVWVGIVLGEVPSTATYVGGTVVVATLVVHSWIGLRAARRARTTTLTAALDK